MTFQRARRYVEPRRRDGSVTIDKIMKTGKAVEVWREDGVWWVTLADGWQLDPKSEVHCFQEETLAELLRAVRAASRCEIGCPCGHGTVDPATYRRPQ